MLSYFYLSTFLVGVVAALVLAASSRAHESQGENCILSKFIAFGHIKLYL